MRDIDKYAEEYDVEGFEKYQVIYRRRKILEIISRYKPEKILEIGCGLEPLFQYVEDARFTIVEPSSKFYKHAADLADNKRNVICIQGFFEDVAGQLKEKYDMVICSSLLHEVERPAMLLKAMGGYAIKILLSISMYRMRIPYTGCWERPWVSCRMYMICQTITSSSSRVPSLTGILCGRYCVITDFR